MGSLVTGSGFEDIIFQSGVCTSGSLHGVLAGSHFWMMYLHLMQAQRMAHVGVQENNVDMIINAWFLMLPMYFAQNKINYARYGSYYVYTLTNMEHLYPGLRAIIDENGLSVQAQDTCPLRTSIDQRGEQTINRDAKTSGKFIEKALHG